MSFLSADRLQQGDPFGKRKRQGFERRPDFTDCRLDFLFLRICPGRNARPYKRQKLLLRNGPLGFHSGRTIESTKSVDEIVFARKNFSGFAGGREVRETIFAHVNVGGRGADQGCRQAGQDADRGRDQQAFHASSWPITRWITPFGAEMKKPSKSSRNCSTSSRRGIPFTFKNEAAASVSFVSNSSQMSG